MMKRTARKFFKLLAPIGILGLGFALMLLFQSPIVAQISPQVIPRIDIITGPDGTGSAYRLMISRPKDHVYVFCPAGHEATLTYLRNVKAIRCDLPAK